jgi:hypothetical protein
MKISYYVEIDVSRIDDMIDDTSFSGRIKLQAYFQGQVQVGKAIGSQLLHVEKHWQCHQCLALSRGYEYCTPTIKYYNTSAIDAQALL